ncbi:MAG TPA: T9SS type A sorting domain-containing protein [Bacteroidia bacterium]|nr:T9SS type A sorting domain-containing protein [Bacteroidia bacterium]
MEVVFSNKVVWVSRYKKLLPLLILLFTCLSFKTFSQSDLCSGAVVLSTGTTAGATTSAFTNVVGDPVPSCESAAGKCNFTGWYKYTTGASGGSLTISLASGAGAIKYASLGLYSGTCGSFTELDCMDQGNVSAATPTVSATCLAPNTTYYLMVFCDGSTNTYPGTFTLTTTFTAGSNDCCNNATVLSTGVTTGATTSSFTISTGDPVPSCESAAGKCNFTGWYKYTTGASGGSLTISLASGAGAIKYASLGLYSGTCGSFTELDCMDQKVVSAATPTVSATCLSPNTTYYLMVFCDGATATYPGTFTLTTTFTPSASADLCSNAIALSVGTTTGDNTCATYSATTDQTVSCQPTSTKYGYTVWYQYTTPSIGDLSVSLASGTIQFASLALYSGSCPGGGTFTELDCMDQYTVSAATPTVSASCLTAGTTYYIMVWCDGSTSSTYGGTFTLTASFATPAASNNVCSGAAVLSTGNTSGNNSCATADATTDPALTTAQCSGFGNGVQNTVWYTYTTPATGANLTISLTRGTIKFAALSILSGTCGAFTSVACNDPDKATTAPSVTANCLSPNTTYYIMVWCDATNGHHGGTYTLTTTSTAPGNDCCFNATALSAGTTTGTNVNATTDSSDPSPSCDGDGHIEATTWYTYTTPASCGTLTISLTHSTIQYASLTLYSGSCGSLTEIAGACSDPYSTTANPSITVSSLAPSTTYYLEVWSDATNPADDGTYSLTTSYSSSTSTNDFCSCAQAITMNTTTITGSYTGSVADDNTNATNDGTSYCFSPHKNLWYTFTAPVAGSYYCGITAGTMVMPEIAIYSGSCSSLTLASCAGRQVITTGTTSATYTFDANNSATYLSQTPSATNYTMSYSPFSLFSDSYTYGGICNLTAGQTAYIMVGNNPNGSGNYGTYTLTVANLKNDDINNALIINNCGSVFQGTTIGGTNCTNASGNGLMNNIDNNTSTGCDNTSTVTSCGTNGVAGSACYGGATTQTDANANGGDIGYSIENDSWYEFCVTATCTVTITFSVNAASCLAPASTATPALQLSAFSSPSNSTGNLTKIYGGYCKENITTAVSFSFAATANSCYFFEIDGYSGANCDYTLRADIIPTCVLAVKLLSFTGKNENGKIKLDWATAEEVNAGKYIIERSDNGVDYVPIITKLAKSNSTIQTNYTVYDDNPLINKINYYKLSEYDLNGKGGLLAQTFVRNTAGSTKFNVYPNPSTGKVNISIKNFSVPSIDVEIMDVFGNTIWSSNIELSDGNSLQEVDLSMFDAGVYFVRTSDGTAFYNQRLIISR